MEIGPVSLGIANPALMRLSDSSFSSCILLGFFMNKNGKEPASDRHRPSFYQGLWCDGDTMLLL